MVGVPIHAGDEYVLECAGLEQVVAEFGDILQIETIPGHLQAAIAIDAQVGDPVASAGSRRCSAHLADRGRKSGHREQLGKGAFEA